MRMGADQKDLLPIFFRMCRQCKHLQHTQETGDKIIQGVYKEFTEKGSEKNFHAVVGSNP